MTFTVVSWKDTAEALLNWAEANPDLVSGILPTDLSVGSLERAQVEALAMAMEEYYFRTDQAITEAISDSCFRAFGFSLLAGSAAAGSVVFSSLAPVAAPITIPQGTLVITRTGEQFFTTSAGVILSGESGSGQVPALASKVGSAGNVPSGSISILPYPIPGVDRISNPSATMGGQDSETPAARVLRFARFIRTLPRGTAPALEYAALSVPGVVSAKAVEPYMLTTPPPGCPYAGLVWLWCDTGVDGGGIDPGVKYLVDQKINGHLDAGVWVDGWKAAGVVVDTRGVSRVPMKIKATILVEEGARPRFHAEIAPLLTKVALQYFSDLSIGEPVIHNALLLELAGVDPDIMEINLKFWPSSGAQPASNAPADIPVVDASVPDSTGRRATVDSGTYVEAGASITYPFWSLA